MAISKSTKIPRGYAVTGYDVFEELSNPDRPPLGDAGRSAPWLPVKTQDASTDEYYTILAGRIVSIDRTLTDRDEYGSAYASNLYSAGYAPRVVPCNSSGAAQPIVYAAGDVSYTVDVDDQESLVSAAGSATATFPANAPVGWIQGNAFSDSVRYRLRNFEKDLSIVLITRYFVEVALIGLSGQSSIYPGCFVKPYAGSGPADANQGLPTYFDPASDSVEQIAGKVTVLSEIPYGTSARSRLDLVRAVPGLSLVGMDTTGKPRHLSSAGATHYCRINITCL